MGLATPAAFFAAVRSGLLGPTLTPDEVAGCSAILAACDGWRLSWTAYALATAYHETAHTMQPVHENGGEAYFTRLYDPQGNNPALANRLGNTQPGDGARYAGRGYVQLTGRANYAKAEAELGEPLVAQPDLAMQPVIAARILRAGMSEGWFTAKALKDYLPDDEGTGTQFTQARRIINGQDRAGLISGYAAEFQNALKAGGWA